MIRGKTFVLFLLLLSGSLPLCGQPIKVSGRVFNGLLQESLVGAVVRLIRPDNASVVATDTTRYEFREIEIDGNTSGYTDKHSGALFSVITSVRDSLWLTVEAGGFETYRRKLFLRLPQGKDKLDVGDIYLMPKAKDKQLREVVVEATRIKMFYKGDTLVYNADAFNVMQTESLRKLVEQLPGAELENGRITVNGKPVEELLISGKNFFGGNIQAALDNLPAYIVDKIKVYDKDGELTELTGKDMHDQRYVMDVHIKREYLGSWFGRMTADGGTEKLYGLGGLLGRMDSRQMFSLSFDVNNYNQERQIMDIATTADVMPEGRFRTKGVGVDYYIEPNQKWRFVTNATVRRSDDRKNVWTNTETFLTPVNQMTRAEQQERHKYFKTNAYASLRYRRMKHSQYELSYIFDYKKTSTNSENLSLSYFLPGRTVWENWPLDSIRCYEEMLGEESVLLYSLLNPTKEHVREVIHRPTLSSVFTLGENVLNFNTEVKHSVVTDDLFNNYRLTYYKEADKDWRRQYATSRDYQIDVKPRLEFIHKYEKVKRYDGVIKPYALYVYRYGTANHPQYRLERMYEWSERTEWGVESLGLLPDGDWQALCLDMQNSYYSRQKENLGEMGLNWSHKLQLPDYTSLQIEASEAFYYERRVLDYQRDAHDYHVMREGIFVRHQASVRWKRENREGRKWLPEMVARYSGTPLMPALTQYLPISDDSDPLNLFSGNPDLNNQYKHEITNSFHVQHVQKGYAFNAEVAYQRMQNDIVTRSEFDAQTGVRTYQPVNTSRTHGVKGRTTFSMPLDKKKRFFLSTSFEANYYQCQNLAFISNEANAAGMLRSVTYKPQMSVRVSIGKNFQGNASWYTAFRCLRQPGVENQYRQTNISVSANYKLPWDLWLASRVLSYIYAGNSMSQLNKPLTLWEASLSKEVKGFNLTLRVHDILARQHNFISTMDAFQRVERTSDVLPRYVMLSLTYNFKWTEKRK